MKNYLDQLVTDLHLEIAVNDVISWAQLHQTLIFDAADTVIIDGIEILPRFVYLAQDNRLTIDQPFYCWYHRVSYQGWLLQPS